jgi:hypothetical protein
MLQLGINFTNILLAQLRQYSCANKKFNLHCKHKKASRETFIQKKGARKMLVKLTLGFSLFFSLSFCQSDEEEVRTYRSLSRKFVSSLSFILLSCCNREEKERKRKKDRE